MQDDRRQLAPPWHIEDTHQVLWNETPWGIASAGSVTLPPHSPWTLTLWLLCSLLCDLAFPHVILL